MLDRRRDVSRDETERREHDVPTTDSGVPTTDPDTPDADGDGSPDERDGRAPRTDGGETDVDTTTPSGSSSLDAVTFDGDGRAPIFPGRRGLALLGCLAVVVGAFAVDYAAPPDATPLLGTDPSQTDWLFVPALVCLGAVVAPLVTDPDRRTRVLETCRARPAVGVATAYLVAFVGLGLVGPSLVTDVTSELARSNQPPLGFTAPGSVVTGCVGTLTDAGCPGTLQSPLGTNRQGIPMSVVIVRGMRVSLQVAVVVGVLVVPVAAVVGTLAGYVGGWVDTLAMRYVDVQQTVPAFLVYIVLTYALGQSLFLLVLVFGLTSWGGVARVVRDEVIQLRETSFVDAAVVHGVGHVRLVVRHVLPNLGGTVATAVTQRIPAILLAEAAISFLLLNDTNVPSWGLAISQGFRAQAPFLDIWWVSTVPVVFLAGTVVAVTVVGDALRDALDAQTTR